MSFGMLILATPCEFRHVYLVLFMSQIVQPHQKDRFESFFLQLTDLFNYLCSVEEIRHCFINQLLDLWKQMIDRVKSKVKREIFMRNKGKL